MNLGRTDQGSVHIVEIVSYIDIFMTFFYRVHLIKMSNIPLFLFKKK